MVSGTNSDGDNDNGEDGGGASCNDGCKLIMVIMRNSGYVNIVLC